MQIKLRELSKDELIEIILEKNKRIEELEKNLKKYKNPNTPSSSNKHIKASTQGLRAKLGAKRGAPKNHNGNTLILPKAEIIIPVYATNCSVCYGVNIRPTGYIKKKKVICRQEAKTYVKEYQQVEYVCLNDNTLFLAYHKDIPEAGIYDKNIQSLVNYYKFKARLPHNLVVDVMNNIHNVPMTEPTSLAITRRVSKKLEPEYQKLEEDIKTLNVVNGDETSHSVNGVNHWIWVFCNSLMSLFKFNKERGGDIIEKTLGDYFEGVLVVDGWRTYKTYSESHTKVLLQRCWSHGIREVKFECEKKHLKLYNWYCDIYEMAKKGKAYKQKKRRHDMSEKCKTELGRWITCAKAHRNLRKLATKIENGGDDWFTAILHPEATLNNNEAERSLRPFVIMRKIIGALRSESGVKTHEVMMSLISTWGKQQKNVFYTLQTSL